MMHPFADVCKPINPGGHVVEPLVWDCCNLGKPDFGLPSHSDHIRPSALTCIQVRQREEQRRNVRRSTRMRCGSLDASATRMRVIGAASGWWSLSTSAKRAVCSGPFTALYSAMSKLSGGKGGIVMKNHRAHRG
eukprot:TRINITY_DN9457_c0_g1_i2.p1 TRINITY_DN9457_c0_g1~~TRINITY_DN9457_c0_g1_i2.p1  ORF type:complete len:134 (+),score=4.03 TRINITY_DN9457_c0_g1_i2:269-670(+)